MTFPAVLKGCTMPLLLELAARPPATKPSYSGMIWHIFRMVDRRFGTAAGDALRLDSLRQVARLHAWLARQERRNLAGSE